MRPFDLLTAGVTAALVAASPAAADVQYVYDSAGRLIKAVYTNGITIEYRYDAAGNRTQIVTSNPPNTLPVASNDAASVDPSASVNVMVLNNDADADNNTLTITGLGTPTGGSVSIQGGGTYIRYTAPATTGNKTFTYTISDGAGGSASATVTVTVSLTNVPPVAFDDEVGATVNTSQSIFVRVNDEDANGHTLTVTNVSNISGGTVDIMGGGSYVRFNAPAEAGIYTFNYTISDGNGGTDVGTVTVNVALGEGPQ
jgi:YD repeat-containing protein